MKIITALAAGILAAASFSASAMTESERQECDGVGSLAAYIAENWMAGETVFDIREDLGVDAAQPAMQNLFYQVWRGFDDLMAAWPENQPFPEPELYKEFWYMNCVSWYMDRDAAEGSATLREYE